MAYKHIYYVAQEFDNNQVLLKVGVSNLPTQRLMQISREIDNFTNLHQYVKMRKYKDHFETEPNAEAVEYLMHTIRREQFRVLNLFDPALKETTEWCLITPYMFRNEFLPLWNDTKRMFECFDDREYVDGVDNEANDELCDSWSDEDEEYETENTEDMDDLEINEYDAEEMIDTMLYPEDPNVEQDQRIDKDSYDCLCDTLGEPCQCEPCYPSPDYGNEFDQYGGEDDYYYEDDHNMFLW